MHETMAVYNLFGINYLAGLDFPWYLISGQKSIVEKNVMIDRLLQKKWYFSIWDILFGKGFPLLNGVHPDILRFVKTVC